MDAMIMEKILNSETQIFFQAGSAMENLAVSRILHNVESPVFSCCDKRHFLDMMFLMRQCPEDDKYQVSDLTWELGENTTVKTIRKYQLNAFDSLLLSVVIAKHWQFDRKAKNVGCAELVSYGPETQSEIGQEIRKKMEMGYDSLREKIHTITLKISDLAKDMGKRPGDAFLSQLVKSLRRFSTTTLEIIEKHPQKDDGKKRRKRPRESHHYTKLMTGYINESKGEIMFSINPVLVLSCSNPGNYVMHPLDAFRECDSDVKILLLQLFMRKQQPGEKKRYEMEDVRKWIYGDVSEQEKDPEKCGNIISQQKLKLKTCIKELCGMKFGEDKSGKQLANIKSDLEKEKEKLKQIIDSKTQNQKKIDSAMEKLEELNTQEGQTKWVMEWASSHGILLSSVVEEGKKSVVVVQRPYANYKHEESKNAMDNAIGNVLEVVAFSEPAAKQKQKSKKQEMPSILNEIILKIGA